MLVSISFSLLLFGGCSLDVHGDSDVHGGELVDEVAEVVGNGDGGHAVLRLAEGAHHLAVLGVHRRDETAAALARPAL